MYNGMDTLASNPVSRSNHLNPALDLVEVTPSPYTTTPTDMVMVGDEPQEIKDFVQHLIDSLPGFVSVFRVKSPDEFLFIACNERSRQTHGATSPMYQGIGKRIEDIMDADSAAKSLAVFKQCLEQRQPVFVEQAYGEGEGEIWIRSEFLPIYNTAGEITHIMTYWIDTTELKRQELADQEHQQQIIQQQAIQLEELSTPLLAISDSTVVMPLIGAIDTRRVQMIMNTLLEGISQNHASTVIIDITGVPLVDTQVADSLLRASQAVRLLGAEVILTGIRPEVAQTLVGLGVNLTNLRVAGTLRDGISIALKKDGLRVI
jgi:rsbT co-antagonist protein RsbR